MVQYWCWSVDPDSEIPDEGWLRQLGFKDFAGSGVIHLVGGTSGLVGCILVGPRKKIKSEGPSKPLQAYKKLQTVWLNLKILLSSLLEI